jgi:excisionase family DNA binding protein
MADLVALKEAAKLLNISEEKLVNFTESGGIKCYRDGDSTKYKLSDLEEFGKGQSMEMADSELLDQIERADDDSEDSPEDTSDATLAGDPLGLEDDSFSLLDDDMEGDGEDSVLITKQDLSALEAAIDSPPDDDSSPELELDEAPLELADDDADLGLEDDKTIMAPIGDLGLLDDEISDDTDDEKTIMAPIGDSGLLDDDMDFNMEDDSTVMAAPGADVIGDDIDTSDDDTQLGVIDNFGVTNDELVLGGADSSDVTLGAADSGINLESPSDTGLLLDDDAVNLSDSEATQLELPAAGDGIDALLEEDKSFNLGTPDGADDMSDSGSQVIALSDTSALGDAPIDAVVSLNEEGDSSIDLLDEIQPDDSPQPVGMLAPAAPELPYSPWIVMCLMIITLVLVLTGMMMADVVKTMWSWNEDTNLSGSGIMEMIIDQLNMRSGS